tara:strand:+ start:466 stop:840 length:375 start_codon:yes stop_codon:yes gene_type:complete
MAFHRSIVRIPRNDRRNNSINCCLCLILYIVFNLILADYWLIINGIVFGIILLGGGFLYFLKKNEDEDIDNNSYDVESENLSEESSEFELPGEDVTTDDIIVAYRIPESEILDDDILVTAEIVN